MKYTKLLLIVGILSLAGVFMANAHYEDYEKPFEQGIFHETMEEIVEEGTYADLETYRTENGGFGGPRWVTDEESFETWKERHTSMEESGYEPGYTRGGQGGYGSRGGCPMRGY